MIKLLRFIDNVEKTLEFCLNNNKNSFHILKLVGKNFAVYLKIWENRVHLETWFGCYFAEITFWLCWDPIGRFKIRNICINQCHESYTS